MRRYVWAGIYCTVVIVVISVLACFLPKYNGFLFLFLILLLADGRLWISLHKRISHHTNYIKFLAGLLFMSPALAIVVAFSIGMVVPFNEWDIPFRTHLVNTILILFVVKLFPVISIFLSDLFRLSRFIRRRISSKTEKKPENCCRKVVTAGWLIGIISGLLLVYGTLFGLFNFKVNRIEIKLSDLPPSFNGFRIVHISDIHLGSWSSKKQLEIAVDSILYLQPDMVVFTGDMFNYRTSEGHDFKAVLQRIRAPYGVYAILGNHDYGDYMSWPDIDSKRKNMEELILFYQQAGWDLLLNAHRIVKKGDDSIVIAGVENWGATRRFQRFGDVVKAISGAENTPVQILLSHDPSHWDSIISKKYPSIDLVLSGHTHGGQVGFMVGEKRYSPSEWAYPHWSGLYRQHSGENPRYLYVNQGLGTIGYTGRLNIPPEITLLILKR